MELEGITTIMSWGPGAIAVLFLVAVGILIYHVWKCEKRQVDIKDRFDQFDAHIDAAVEKLDDKIESKVDGVHERVSDLRKAHSATSDRVSKIMGKLDIAE